MMNYYIKFSVINDYGKKYNHNYIGKSGSV